MNKIQIFLELYSIKKRMLWLGIELKTSKKGSIKKRNLPLDQKTFVYLGH